MRDLTLAINSVITKKKTKNPSAVLKWNIAILVSILSFGALYLFQINSLGTKGYVIRNLEVKIKQLETENKHLEVQTSSLKSITRIEQEAESRNFVPASNVTYIKDAGFALK
ncbi:MAG: hypothetical protein ACM3NH_03930 [Candidatus Saccharibacteria bacterium]